VSAFQSSSRLSSSFQIIATARSGHTLSEIQKVIMEEISRIKHETPSAREVQRVINEYEASFLDRLENIGGKADQLNSYFSATGNPDYFNEDLSRYKSLSPEDIRAAAQSYLREDGMVVLSIVPEGKLALAVPVQEGGK
jgi:zinc protease